MNKLIFALLFSLIAHLSFAQTGSVSGAVTDKNTQAAVPFAQVLLIHLPDSAITPSQSDIEGRFKFENIAAGRYELKILNLGYKPLKRTVQVADQPVLLGRIDIEEDAKKLKEVEVVGKAAATVQKGDTSEFNSKAFKTAKDASAEELVQKMPGVTMVDGKVQAQAEDVKQVTVDGKKFFGDDAAAALKNLPAEVIDKIQVFDQQSEQSKFSGFNDGNTTKTLNIVTKAGMRNGKFGKAYVGIGTDSRYQAGGNINFMDGSRRISIVAQTNNINQQNFSSEDLLGVTSAGGGQGGRGGRGGQGGRPGGGPGGNFGGQSGGASDFQVNARNGISKTHAFGLNYADQWGKNVEVSGSYFLNAADNLSRQNVLQEYAVANDSGRFYTETSILNSLNINHRLNMRIDWKLDTMNSILFQPRLSLQQNDGTSDLVGVTVANNQLLNSTDKNLETNLIGYNFSGDLLYRHRFLKRGRTFSAGFNSVFSGNTGERFLMAENKFLKDGVLETDSPNQFSDLKTTGPSYGANLNYTEPVSEKGSLSLDYNANYRPNEADQKTFDYSEADKAYTKSNTGLSNIFNSNYLSQQAGAGYRYNNKDVQFMLRATYQYATLKSEQEFPFQGNINRDFSNVLPMAMLRYNFTKEKNLRMFYRTSTNPPSVNQLQNVVDNSNPLLLTTGNPGLAQDYRHNFVARYSSANPGKSTSFFALLGGELAQDYIANSTTIARQDSVLPGGVLFPKGTQLSRPVNLDGFYRIRSFMTYGVPVNFFKSNLNLNASATFTRSPGEINNAINYANTQAYGLGVVLSSNISENLDFTISTNPTYNLVQNTLQTNSDNNYFNLNSTARLKWIFWKGLFLQSDLTHQYYSGLSAGIDQQYLLWNAAVGKKLFRNNQGELKLSAFDLLHQNNSIQRNITETYVEDVETNVLQQYFMLVFTYNIRSFGGGRSADTRE